MKKIGSILLIVGFLTTTLYLAGLLPYMATTDNKVIPILLLTQVILGGALVSFDLQNIKNKILNRMEILKKNLLT
jgi:hypothetical protein